MPELKLPVTIDQYVCGKEKPAEDLVVSAQGGIRNVVVWLDKPPAGATAEVLPTVTTMDQEGMRVRAAHRPRAGQRADRLPEQ